MKYFSDKNHQFVTSVSHQGKIIALATNQIGGTEAQSIQYRILNLQQDNSSTKQINEAIDEEDWGPVQTLSFSTQIRQVGMSLLSIKNSITIDSMTIPPLVSDLPIQTANREFQVVSDSKTVFVFRQSANNTLLVDQFILTIDPGSATGNSSGSPSFVLMPKWEVRFKRSGNKDTPKSQKDSPGYKSVNGKPFIKPTLELSMVKNLIEGRFTIALVPSQTMGEEMWHIFYYNSANLKLELHSIPKTNENSFDLKNKLIESTNNKSGALLTAGNILPDMSFNIDNGALLYGPSTIVYTKQEYYNPDLEGLEESEGMNLKRGYRLMLANAILDQRICLNIQFYYYLPLVRNRFQCFVYLPADAILTEVPESSVNKLTVPLTSEPVNWVVSFNFNIQLKTPGSITIYSGGIWQKQVKLGIWVGSGTNPSGTLWISGPYELQGQNLITIPITQVNTPIKIKIEPMDVGINAVNNNLVYSLSKADNKPISIMDFGIGKDGSLVKFVESEINLGETITKTNTSGEVEISGGMPQLFEDQNGLTLEGTILSYIDAAGTPFLQDSSEGIVKLYLQTDVSSTTGSNFSVANFNPELGRAIKHLPLNNDNGQLNFIANKLGSQYTDAIINASNFGIKGGYGCNLEIKIPAYNFETGAYWVSEFWYGLPRRADEAAEILNGNSTDDINDPLLRNGGKLFFDFKNKWNQLYILNKEPLKEPIGVLTLVPKLLKNNSNKVSVQLSSVQTASGGTEYSMQISCEIMPFRMNAGYSSWGSSTKKQILTQTYNNLPNDTSAMRSVLNGLAEGFYDYLGNTSVTPNVPANFISANPFSRLLVGKNEILFFSGDSTNYTLSEIEITETGLNFCDVTAYFKNASGVVQNRLIIEGVPRVPSEFVNVIQGTSAKFDYATKSIWQTKKTPPAAMSTVMQFVTKIWEFLDPSINPDDPDLNQWPANTSANISGYSSKLSIYNNAIAHEFEEFQVGSQFISVFPYLAQTSAFVLSQANVLINQAAGLTNQDGNFLQIPANSIDYSCAYFVKYEEEQIVLVNNDSLLNLSSATSPALTSNSLSTVISVSTSGNDYNYLLKKFTFNNVKLTTVGNLQNLTITIKDISLAVIASFSIEEDLSSIENGIRINNLYGSVSEVGAIQEVQFISVIKTATDFDLVVNFPVPILFRTGTNYTIELSATDTTNPTTNNPIIYTTYATVVSGGTATFNYAFEHIPELNTSYEFWTRLSSNANILINVLRGKNLQYSYAGSTTHNNVVANLSDGSDLVDAEHALLIEEFFQELNGLSTIESMAQPLYSGTPGILNLESATIAALPVEDGQSVDCSIDHLLEKVLENRRTMYFTATPQIWTDLVFDALIGQTSDNSIPSTNAELGSIDFYGIPTTVDCGSSALLNPTTNGISILFSFDWDGSITHAPAPWHICSKGTFDKPDFCYDVQYVEENGTNYLIFRIKVLKTTANTNQVLNATANTNQVYNYKIDIGTICSSAGGPYSVAFTAVTTNVAGAGSILLAGYVIQPSNVSAGLFTTLPVVNGSVASTPSTTYAFNSPEISSSFGMGGAGYFSLKGMQVWNKALSQAEVIANVLFGGATNLDTGLVAFWPFNEDAGMIVRDVVGNNDGQLASEIMLTAYQPPSITEHQLNNWKTGYKQKAIELLVDEYISYPAPSASKNLDIAQSLMIEAWVKPDFASGTVDASVFNLLDYSHTVPAIAATAAAPLQPINQISNFSLDLAYDSTKASYGISATKDTQKISTTNTVVIPNAWNHICASFRSGFALRFLSGQSVNCGKQGLNPGVEGLTLSCWVKINTAGNAVLMSKRSDTGVCYELIMNASRQVSFVMNGSVSNQPGSLNAVSNGNLQYTASLGTLNLNEWTHLAVSVQFKIDRQTTKEVPPVTTKTGELIVNTYKGFTNVTTFDSTPATDFKLEFTTSSQALFLGISSIQPTTSAVFEMAGVQYWNKGIGLDIIKQNAGIKGIASDSSAQGLVSFWPCSEGEGSVLLDKQQMNDGSLTSENMWQHSSLGAETAIYVNGIMQEINTAEVPRLTTNQFSIGGIPGTSSIASVTNGYLGSFSEIRIWDLIRTKEEIMDNMFTQLDGSEKGLLMYLGYEKDKNNLNDLSLGAFNGSFEAPIIQFEQYAFDLSIVANYSLIETYVLKSWLKIERYRTIYRTAKIKVVGSMELSSLIVFQSKNDTIPGEIDYVFNLPGTTDQGIDFDFGITYDNSWQTARFEVFVNGVSQQNDASGSNGLDYVGTNKISNQTWNIVLSPGINTIKIKLQGTVHTLSGTYAQGQIAAGEYGQSQIAKTVEHVPSWQLAQIPIGDDIPEISSLPVGNTNQFSASIQGQPTVLEYGDMQIDDNGELLAVLKRFYAFIDTNNKVQLITGFKIGEADLSFVGQVQTKPTLKGIIEGPPPVPSENLTENDKSDIGSRFTPVDDFDGTSSISINKEEGDHRTFSTSEESGNDLSTSGWAGMEFGEEANVGVAWGAFFGHKIAKVQLKGGAAWDVNMSSSSTRENSQSTEFDNTETNQANFHGHWEMPKDYKQNGVKDWLIPEMGKRYEGNNKGYALVESETADLFALRMRKTGAVIGYQTQPNTDIPKDTNIIMFNVNPEYTKYSTLDGMVGLVPDPMYPQAKYGVRGSYFKPIEAYALKAKIQKDKQKILAYYDQMNPTAQGISGNSNLPDWVKSLANRDIVNSYVWTAKGGFFAESEQYASTRMQAEGGSSSLDWKVGIKAEGSVVIGIVGLFYEMDAMNGKHRMVSVVGENEKTSVLNMEVEVEGNRWLREWDWEAKDYLATDAPGKVNSYRFMSFFLSPKIDNFDSFYDQVVDENWLYNSASPDAIALLEAKGEKVAIWRSFHRVTYVNRVPPPFELSPKEDAPPSIQKPVNLDSNVWLIHLVSNYLSGEILSVNSGDIGNAVESILNQPLTTGSGGTQVDNPYYLGGINPWWNTFRTEASATPYDPAKNKQFMQIIQNCKEYMMNYYATIKMEN